MAAASDPDFSALWNGAFVFSPCLVLLLSTVLDWDLERAMGMISGDTLLLFLLLWGISSLSGCVLCSVFVDFFLLGVFYHGALLEMRMRGLERWLDGVG